MAKARNWNNSRTLFLTFLCGLGHVGSSAILGLLGIAFGIGLHNLTIFESLRGGIASWMLMAFGLAYFIWALRRYLKHRTHKHIHFHADGSTHEHIHTHEDAHLHVHDTDKKNITPWILFTVFVLGPCEPLIPLLMYPAAKNSIKGMVMVISVFSIVTISTMVTTVYLAMRGFELIKFEKFEKYTNILAGISIFLTGVIIIAFNL
jgi:ABC-type nickel/cobalt efflux system permease component RcnA